MRLRPSNILLIVVLLAVFYALMILPQRRQQKKRSEMMRNLGPGARILTTSGIYGKVVSMQDDLMVVRVTSDVQLDMDPRAVLRVVEPAPTATTETETQTETAE